MPTLQKINLGTPPAGKDGESTRAGFVKMNANVDVLSAQAALTSVAPIISTAIELDSTYLGARVILQPTAAATLTWPKASTCSPDGVIMIVNASAYPISHSVRAGDTFVNSVAFGPWETALVSTDGVNTWRVLIRSRATSSNEQVPGSLSVGGRLLVGGAADDGSSDLQVKGTANISKFSSRPMFAGNTPWDSGNFTPSNYFPKTGGSLLGGIDLPQGGVITLAGGKSAIYQDVADPGPGNLVFRTGTVTARYVSITKDGWLSLLENNAKIRMAGGPAVFYHAVDTSGAYTLYNASGVGVFLANGATGWSANSDETLKNIRSNIDNAVASVKAIRTVLYTWKSDDERNTEKGGDASESRVYAGVIAQDVEQVMPVAVTRSESGKLAVTYTDLVPLALAAIKELAARVEALEGTAR